MKATVVVGMQYGSEGKGRICAMLAEEYRASMRVQSIQAGHTIYKMGKKYKMRTIPCAWVNPNAVLLIGPGAFIDMELLIEELEMLKDFDVDKRLYIDKRVCIVEKVDHSAEGHLVKAIGSTGEGSGASLSRKIMRQPVKRIGDCYIPGSVQVIDVIEFMQKFPTILVEGAQGTMLSIHTSQYYPYLTARECTVSGILSETGISPRDVDRVIGVMRTYPIRVGGNSGPTGGDELTWETITKRSGSPIPLSEVTTVTNRVRRIFEFSDEDMRHSIMVNKPDYLYCTFGDYIDYRARFEGLTDNLRLWIHEMRFLINMEMCWMGYNEFEGKYI